MYNVICISPAQDWYAFVKPVSKLEALEFKKRYSGKARTILVNLEHLEKDIK